MRREVIKNRGYAQNTLGDELSLEIASYPVTAQYLAKRLSHHGTSICELCCGIGMSLVEFSKYFSHAIGVDNDNRIIGMAKENLKNMKINNFELITGDIADGNVLSSIHADIVAYDIPYWSNHHGKVKDSNPVLKDVVEAIRANISSKIVIYAPPIMTIDREQLQGDMELQEVWIDGRHDRNFVYLGELIDTPGITKIELSVKGL